MVTQPYVPSRTILGALTSSLTKKLFPKDPLRTSHFLATGIVLNYCIRTSYFYLKGADNNGKIHFPWQDSERFFYRFIGSSVHAPRNPLTFAAEEGMLYETEFIVPRTKDTGDPVCLLGYFFVREPQANCINDNDIECLLPEDLSDLTRVYEVSNGDVITGIKNIINNGLPAEFQIQNLLKCFSGSPIGGERNYGWGKLVVMSCRNIASSHSVKEELRLFEDPKIMFLRSASSGSPCLRLEQGAHLPAHLLVGNNDSADFVKGAVEPLGVKVWGGKVFFHGVAYKPGQVVTAARNVYIASNGYLVL